MEILDGKHLTVEKLCISKGIQFTRNDLKLNQLNYTMLITGYIFFIILVQIWVERVLT